MEIKDRRYDSPPRPGFMKLVHEDGAIKTLDANGNELALGGDVIAALEADPEAARDAMNAQGIVNVLDYGATGDGTTDDTVAIQAAMDAAGLAGKPLYFPGTTSAGYYKVTAPLVINYSGMTFFGDAWNTEETNGSKIRQATSYTDLFQLSTPAVSHHNITFDRLYLQGPSNAAYSGTAWVTATAYVIGDVRTNNGFAYRCTANHTSGASTEPGRGTSSFSNWMTYSGAGINFAFNPVSAPFSDFHTFRNVQIRGFDVAVKLSRCANTSFHGCLFYLNKVDMEVGGNCNSIAVYSSQFNSASICNLHLISACHLSLYECEAGNGPKLFIMDVGGQAVGMNLVIKGLETETYSQSSQVVNAALLEVDTMRALPGGHTTVAPFTGTGSCIVSIKDVQMPGFVAGTPVYKGTTGASPIYSNFAQSPPPPVVIYSDDTYAVERWRFGVNRGVMHNISGSTTAAAERVGQFRHIPKDTVSGGTVDQYEICLRNGTSSYAWFGMVPGAERAVNISAGTTLGVNRIYQTTGGSECAFILPASAGVKLGDFVEVIGTYGTAGFKITQVGSQRIRYGSSLSSAGAAGKISTTGQWDCIRLVYVDVELWQVINQPVGTFVTA